MYRVIRSCEDAPAADRRKPLTRSSPNSHHYTNGKLPFEFGVRILGSRVRSGCSGNLSLAFSFASSPALRRAGGCGESEGARRASPGPQVVGSHSGQAVVAALATGRHDPCGGADGRRASVRSLPMSLTGTDPWCPKHVSWQAPRPPCHCWIPRERAIDPNDERDLQQRMAGRPKVRAERLDESSIVDAPEDRADRVGTTDHASWPTIQVSVGALYKHVAGRDA